MRVAAQAATGQPGGVEQAGVVEPVLHADVVVVSQQCLLHGEVGDEAAVEQQRARVAKPVGHFPLQLLVQGVVAADQRRGRAARAFA